MDTPHEIVRHAEENYLTGNTKLGKYVDWSMHDTIETIDAYLNSKHVSGATDSLGRDKPFFNIVLAAVNIWWRATDIDRKDIHIVPDSSDDVAVAFIATVLLQNWMKDARFGVFLNEWGRALARYGSAVVKFVEQGGEMIATVVPWNRFIADPVDFDAIPRIEKLYKTAEQLRKNKSYDQTAVDSLLSAIATRKTLDGNAQDNQGDFIELYEVHGNLPTYFLKDDPKIPEPKDVKYCQQMHVVSFVKSADGKTFDDFTLYKGKEAKDPYMLTHLIKEDGRTLAVGCVEYLFDAQWMANHTMKNWKDQLDLASRLIFQTADQTFQGRNVLTALETGDILVHQANAPLTAVENVGHDATNMQSFYQQWNELSQEITSTPDAMRGVALPAGTAYAQAALLTRSSSSFLAMMSQNKALALEDMLRTFILPHLAKKLDNKDEVVGIMDDSSIAEIDAMYVPREAVRRHNQQVKDALLKGEIPSPYQADIAEGQVSAQLSKLGNKRFFKPDEIGRKTWKDAFKSFEMKAIVEIGDEATDEQATLTTLSTVFQTIASNPGVLQDPNAKMLFGRILSQTGAVSPLEIQTPQPPAAQPTQPQMPSVPGTAPVPTSALPQQVVAPKQVAAPLVGG